MLRYPDSEWRDDTMSVYKDEKGNWYCVFRYKDFSGKTIQKKKRGFKTKREAKEFETEYQKKAAGQADMTFQSLTELYLADCKARHKPNIYENEKTRARLALLPFFEYQELAERVFDSALYAKHGSQAQSRRISNFQLWHTLLQSDNQSRSPSRENTFSRQIE